MKLMKTLLIMILASVSVSAELINPNRNIALNGNEIIYICTGPKAKVYHHTPKCKGLRKCNGNIKPVTKEKAETMGRRACRICSK